VANPPQFDALVGAVAAQEAMLDRVEQAPSLRPQGLFGWTVGHPVLKAGVVHERMHMPLDVTMTTEEKVQVTVSPVTATGQPATLDGPVSFTVIVGDCTIEPIDALSAYIVSGSALADSLVQVSADADLGSGVQTVEDAVTVHVHGAMATSLGMSAGTPIPK
jgi:hypothetical protein